jgi:hypothetical protein
LERHGRKSRIEKLPILQKKKYAHVLKELQEQREEEEEEEEEEETCILLFVWLNAC